MDRGRDKRSRLSKKRRGRIAGTVWFDAKGMLGNESRRGNLVGFRKLRALSLLQRGRRGICQRHGKREGRKGQGAIWSPTGEPVAPFSTPVGRNPERELPAEAGARVEGSQSNPRLDKL